MTADVGTYLRLRGTLKALIEAAPEDKGIAAPATLPTAYKTIRSEIRHAVDPATHEEFDRLFPEWSAPIMRDAEREGYEKHRLATEHHYEARALLSELGGWLDGLIEAAVYETRLQAEAQAYAEARVKQERMIGFAGGTTGGS